MGTKTQNYQLNQWAAEDSFLRADFNEDNAKIDAALGTIPKVIAGTYTGEAASLGYGGGLTKDITLGFRPKALFITTGGSFDGATSIVLFGTMSAESNGKVLCKLTDSGFTVGTAMYGSDLIYPHLNSKNYTYHYLALG